MKMINNVYMLASSKKTRAGDSPPVYLLKNEQNTVASGLNHSNDIYASLLSRTV